MRKAHWMSNSWLMSLLPWLNAVPFANHATPTNFRRKCNATIQTGYIRVCIQTYVAMGTCFLYTDLKANTKPNRNSYSAVRGVLCCLYNHGTFCVFLQKQMWTLQNFIWWNLMCILIKFMLYIKIYWHL